MSFLTLCLLWLMSLMCVKGRNLVRLMGLIGLMGLKGLMGLMY